jgi:hypothetical protein
VKRANDRLHRLGLLAVVWTAGCAPGLGKPPSAHQRWPAPHDPVFQGGRRSTEVQGAYGTTLKSSSWQTSSSPTRLLGRLDASGGFWGGWWGPGGCWFRMHTLLNPSCFDLNDPLPYPMILATQQAARWKEAVHVMRIMPGGKCRHVYCWLASELTASPARPIVTCSAKINGCT